MRLCSRWAGMVLACQQKTRRLPIKHRLPNGRLPILTACAHSLNCLVCLLTGHANLPLVALSIISGSSGCFYSYTKKAWFIKSLPPSTGIRSTTPSWPTNKSLTVKVGEVALWSKSATSRCITLTSPIMLMSCLMI